MYYYIAMESEIGTSVKLHLSDNISTVGSRFMMGLWPRIFGCKSNCKRVLFEWFKLR